jgi:hypothetical protein
MKLNTTQESRPWSEFTRMALICTDDMDVQRLKRCAAYEKN